MNTLNEITITLSVDQLYLLNALSIQSNKYIFSHLKTNEYHVVHGKKIQTESTSESITLDSGIHSTGDNGKLLDQENDSISFIENKINSQSSIALFSKK